MRCNSPPRLTILLLYTLQALLLLLLLAAAVLPCVNASANKSTISGTVARRGNVTVAEAEPLETTLIGCYPGIFLYNSNITYDCVVEDASMARGWDVYTLHFYGAAYKGGWHANVDAETNTVSFVAGNGTYSGTMAFSIQRGKNGAYLSFVAKTHQKFIQPEETSATFTVSSLYYGMELAVWTNLPSEETASGYLLVGSSAECQKITANCNADAGCHNVTEIRRLPPPGTYHLCVTASNWRNRYLPWGQFLLKVSALVSHSRYLVQGKVPSIKLHTADTGDMVDSAWTLYIVRCESENCPSVISQGGDAVVDVAVCDESSQADRLYLSDRQLIATPGMHALCVADANNHVSPAAIPVTVVQHPFAMEIISVLDSVVKLHVSGGDVENRKDRYAVCVADEGALCTSVTPARNQCTWSTSPNSDFVDVDLRKVTSGNVTLCLVAKNFTFSGYNNIEVVAEEKYVLRNETGGGGSGWVWIVILVGVSCLFLLYGIIIVICFKCKKRRSSRSKDLDEEPYANAERQAF